MRLAALSLFATLGTLTEAAEQLGVTRSALSDRIAELEKRLGVALVRKVGRRIALTEDGERLLSSMGDALDRIEAAVEPFRRDRGQIRLSTVVTFASHWRIKWLTVETRAQALDAAMAGAGVALIDMAYTATPATEGKLVKLAERPLPLQTRYYFVHTPNARNLHLLKHLRDWAVEAARPFRVA